MSDSSGGPNFCSNCGNPIKNPNANFCATCGFKFNRVGETTESKEYQGEIIADPVSQPTRSPSPPVGASTGQANSPYGQYGEYGAYQQQPRENLVTPNSIQSVNRPYFKKAELKIIGAMILAALGSHFLRYLIMFNRFPTVDQLVYPIPIYALFILGIFLIQKRLFYNKGVASDIEADRYDHMISLILSTFFLTTISHRIGVNKESSTIPDHVHTPQPGKLGITYVELPRMGYIGSIVRPKTYFQLTFAIIGLSFIALYLYFNPFLSGSETPFRLLAAYLGGYAVLEVAPSFGRHNKEMLEVGRFRTLLLFLLALVITIIGLLGKGFFFAVTN